MGGGGGTKTSKTCKWSTEGIPPPRGQRETLHILSFHDRPLSQLGIRGCPTLPWCAWLTFLSHERCVLVYSCHTNVVCLSVYFCYTTLGGLFLLHWSSSPLTNRNVVVTAEGGFHGYKCHWFGLPRQIPAPQQTGSISRADANRNIG